VNKIEPTTEWQHLFIFLPILPLAEPRGELIVDLV